MIVYSAGFETRRGDSDSATSPNPWFIADRTDTWFFTIWGPDSNLYVLVSGLADANPLDSENYRKANDTPLVAPILRQCSLFSPCSRR